MRRDRLVAWMQWLIPLVAVAAAALFIHSKSDFLRQGLLAVRHAQPGYVWLASLAGLCAFYTMGEVTVRLLAAGGVKVRRGQAFALALAANAWSASIPGGQGAAAMFSFTVMRRWGASSVLCSWQILMSATLSTVWLIGLGVASIFLLGADFSLTSSVLSLLLLVGLSAAAGFIAWHPWVLLRPGLWGLKILNYLRRKPTDYQAQQLINHIERLDTFTLSPQFFAMTSLWSLAKWLTELAALWWCVQAVTGGHHGLSLAGCALAFVTSKLAGTVQATPGGIGPVEAALTATLVAAGLAAAHATAAVVLYRLITLFAMTVVGWVVYGLAFVRRGFRAKVGG